MTRRTSIFCAAALAVSALCGSLFAQPPAGSPVAKHGKLSVSGNRIVNNAGQPVALRGMSFFWNQWSEGSVYYTAGVTNWLASDWKVDVVRVAINPGNSGDNDNWKTVVDAAIAQGIYVIIDWHSHTAEQQLQQAKTFFGKRAAQYKDTPNVLFEIFNEPIEQSWATIRSYATSVVDTIRQNNANNIIIIGSRDYSKRVDEAAANPVSGTNLAYSVHYYTAEPGTQHQGDLRGYCNVALNAGLALFVTEFGLSEADGGGKDSTRNKIDTVEANVWFEFLDKSSIGWANWSICNKNEAASAVRSSAGTNGNWSANDITPSGTFIRQKLINYATKTWTVTATTSGQGGTVAMSPSGGPTYKHGTMVTLIAVPQSGWAFEGWGGADGSNLGTKNPATFPSPLYSNKSVQAIFGQGSMISNGTFTNNTNGWSSSSTTIAQEDGTLKATITGGTAYVRQTDLNLSQNTKYSLSFRAKATTGTVAVTPRITSSNGQTVYWEGQAVQLTSAWTSVNTEFCMSADNAAAQIRFQTNQMTGGVWYLDDVMMNPAGACQGSAVSPTAVREQRASWSLSRTGGALQLRGPAESGAVVSLYDVRGKSVRSMAAVDGLTLSGIPAGSYFVVVKNRAGGEVLRTKVVMAR